MGPTYENKQRSFQLERRNQQIMQTFFTTRTYYNNFKSYKLNNRSIITREPLGFCVCVCNDTIYQWWFKVSGKSRTLYTRRCTTTKEGYKKSPIGLRKSLLFLVSFYRNIFFTFTARLHASRLAGCYLLVLLTGGAFSSACRLYFFCLLIYPHVSLKKCCPVH